MKKMKYVLPILLAFTLSGCGLIKDITGHGRHSSQTASSGEETSQEGGSQEGGSQGGGSQGGSDTSSANPSGGQESLWPEEIQAEMLEYIGEVLPYMPLNLDTMYSGFEDAYYSMMGYYIYYVGDDNENNVTNGYDALLVSAGYEEFVDDDGDTYYQKNLNGNDLVVSFDYFEASDEYEAGNEIDVYIYPEQGGQETSSEETSQGGDSQVGTSAGPYETSSEDPSSEQEESLWSSEIQAEMLQYVGEILPYMPLNEDTMYHEYDDSDYSSYGYYLYVVGDDNETDLTAGYADKLVAMGYEAMVDDNNDPCYYKNLNDNDLYVYANYYEATDQYNAGNEIDVYIFPSGGQGGGGEETPDGTKMDFSDSSTYGVTVNANTGTLTVGEYTITVTKGTSTIDVGGEGQQYFPGSTDASVRVYAGQVMTITWSGSAPSQIVFESKYDNRTLSGATVSGGTLTVNELISTINVTGSSVEITLATQARFLSIEFK